MAWTNLSYAYGSVLTSLKMTQLYDNFAAFANKDAGAPTLAASYVTQTMIAATAIGQGELNTSLNTISGTGYQGTTLVLLASGQYTFMGTTMMGAGSGADTFAYDPAFSANFNSISRLEGVRISYAWNVSPETCYIRHRYINASPPYDPFGLGDQDLFVYAMIDNASGNVIAAWEADDPPWAHNGPTDNSPDTFIKGIPCKEEIDIPAEFSGVDMHKADPVKRLEFISALPQFEKRIVPIDNVRKNADMALIPHPWQENDLAGKSIVLLCGSKLLEQLRAVRASGDEIGNVLAKGYLNIDNSNIAQAKNVPNEILVVGAKWKDTV